MCQISSDLPTVPFSHGFVPPVAAVAISRAHRQHCSPRQHSSYWSGEVLFKKTPGYLRKAHFELTHWIIIQNLICIWPGAGERLEIPHLWFSWTQISTHSAQAQSITCPWHCSAPAMLQLPSAGEADHRECLPVGNHPSVRSRSWGTRDGGSREGRDVFSKRTTVLSFCPGFSAELWAFVPSPSLCSLLSAEKTRQEWHWSRAASPRQQSGTQSHGADFLWWNIDPKTLSHKKKSKITLVLCTNLLFFNCSLVLPSNFSELHMKKTDFWKKANIPCEEFQDKLLFSAWNF